MNKSTDKLKKKKPKGKRIKKFFIVLMFFMILLIGGGTYVLSSLNKISAKSPEFKNQNSLSSGGVLLSFLPSKPSKSSNILMLGADYISGESSDFTRRRTDTMLIAHYDAINEKVIAVSVPRDTQVKFGSNTHKLNAINEIGGPKLVIETLKEITGINIDYYVIIDYKGFNKVIDEIGGVDLIVPQRMKYDDQAQDYHIDYEKNQKIHLDGKGAETFFRWRQNNHGITTDTIDAGGDLGRIENQKVLIRAVIEKVSKPTMIIKTTTLLEKVTESVITDMMPLEMLSYAYGFSSVGTNNFQFVTLKGEPQHTNAWYYIYDYKKNIDLINSLNKNTVYFNRSDLKVKLLNESNSSTAPTNIKQSLLNNAPYDNSRVSTSKEKTTIDESYVEIYDIDSKYNDIILDDFKKFNINSIVNKSGKDTYDIIVHIGKDYQYAK
jgi:LCP family protein required for cell wall assembly